MTKQFLEITFPQDSADIEDGTPPEIIRLAVVDQLEATTIYNKLPPDIKDRPHTAHLHKCNHSAAGNAPCIMHELSKAKPC